MVSVLLPDPDANWFPSGLQATLKTELVCHVNVARIGVSVGAWVGGMVGTAVAGAAAGGARVREGDVA